jgi:hypothetical protein
MNIVLKDGEKLSDIQVKQLYQMFDLDGDGFIDYEEFLGSLKVIDTTKKKGPRDIPSPRSPKGVMPIPPWIHPSPATTTTKK